MQIDKRNRTELKKYFVKNAIPTEGNFAELIEGMLNQKDDGIAKLPNDALSIEAAGDATSQKKAINFYTSFGDDKPTWVLSLNPRQNPADPTTARAGFSIGNSAGHSRLFIDHDTDRIGVGTTNPLSTLTVHGPNASLRITSGNDNGYVFENDNADNYRLKLRYKNPTNVYSELMTFDYNGDVGVGAAPGGYSFNVSAKVIKLGVEKDGGGQLIIGHNLNDNMVYLEAYNASGKDSAAALWLTGASARPVPQLNLVADNTKVRSKAITLGLEGNGGGQLVLCNNPNDNMVYLEAFGANGQGSAAAMWLTGAGARPAPQLNLLADTTNVTSKVIKLGLEGNGGGQLVICNNPNDNRIYLEAFSSNGQGHASELLLTGRNGQPVPLLSLVGTRINLNGAVFVNGIQRYDLAEVTPACADDQLEQGDVVVIDREDGARVRRSLRPCDPAVYGIVSSYEQAAMIIGGSAGGPDQAMQAKDRLPVALAGRVQVKVTAENGPIRVGDLLTTSSTPGHAMRCPDPAAHPGAIAGKALAPLAAGTGVITALVTLQ